MRAMAGLLAWLLLAAPAGAQTVVERTLPFEPDGAFRVMAMEVDVRTRVWDRDSVRVVARLDPEGRRGFYMGVSPTGEGGKMGVEGDGRGEIEVTLPRSASLWVKTSGGAIDVEGVQGMLDVFSVTGDVRVTGAPRSLHAESMGGRVVLGGEPAVARIRTGAGGIEVAGGGPDLSLSSVNGEIELVPRAPLRRVSIETVSGGILVRGALAAGSVLEVDSHDGGVALALPRSTSADFVVSTLEGELRNGLTSGGARKTTGLRGRELSFTAGHGGAQVTVRTFSGDVTIRPIQTAEGAGPSQ